MTIAAFATGCERGFIYIRGEYPLAAERLPAAIDVARARGLLGSDIMGRGFQFDIEIRRGGGAYICGEETAIFNSIEGLSRRAPQQAPVPGEVGVFGKPTLAHNRTVETLVNVLEILRIGGPAYAAVGTRRLVRPRLFCLSGCVARPACLRGAVWGDPGGRWRLWPAGLPAGGRFRDSAGRGGRCLRATGRAGRAAHIRGHPGGPGHARLRRHHGLRRHDRTGADSAPASRRSSGTNPAVSACPAGSDGPAGGGALSYPCGAHAG